MNQELMTYIKTALQGGNKIEDVRATLLGAGWPQADVEDAIAASTQTQQPQATTAAPVAIPQSAAPAGNQVYVRDPKTRRKALIMVVAPLLSLIIILVVYAIASAMLSRTLMQGTLKPPTLGSEAVNGAQNYATSIGLGEAPRGMGTYMMLRAVLGLLGILVVIAIMFLTPIGIVLLFKKKLDPAAPYDERSGQGRASVVPAEIKGWNWGAAGLTFIWGVYYYVWISLLTFIPGISLIVMIYLGLKGNESAWKKNRWASAEAFRETQDKWRVWGIVFFILTILSLVGQIMGGASSLLALATLF